VLDTPPPRRAPALWDGRAAQRIAETIVLGGGPAGHSRPTALPRPLAEAPA
jgi:hypothetical protein